MFTSFFCKFDIILFSDTIIKLLERGERNVKSSTTVRCRKKTEERYIR